MTGTSTAAPRVLVVEDEYLIRMLLEDMLDELGYGGWVGCEYRPAGDTVAGLKWRQEFGV